MTVRSTRMSGNHVFQALHGPSHGGTTEHVLGAAAGVTFSVLLTEAGRGRSIHTTRVQKSRFTVFNLVFCFRSGEKGQLGRGRTGEHIISAGGTGFDVEAVVCTGLVSMLCLDSLQFRSFGQRTQGKEDCSSSLWSATYCCT